MMHALTTDYDVIVIGSGIGGLCCAIDLAKEGHSVLVVEKHHTVGGYCSSFTKGGIYFDAGAHYLGSCRERGQIGQLLQDHNLLEQLTFIRCDPSDRIIISGREILISPEREKFLYQLQQQFPKESRAIEQFVEFVSKTPTADLYIRLKNKTFRDILDEYFTDETLKCSLAMLLGNIGLPSTRAAAVTSILLFREFIIDGGYYPKGGMQRFPDTLVQRINEYGGCVLTLATVVSINLNNTSGKVVSCVIKQGRSKPTTVHAKVVVANCDPFQLFFRLLPDKMQGYWEEYGFINKRVSISAFMLYIGAKGDVGKLAGVPANIWFYGNGNVDQYYQRLYDSSELETGKNGFVFCSLPSLHDRELIKDGRHSLQAIVGAPIMTREFWENERERFTNDVLGRLENVLPGLMSHIELVRPATPFTLEKYTGNHMGAMYGWASTVDQLGLSKFASDCPIEGLFLTGHWAGLPVGYSGVPLVVSSGRSTAKRVAKYIRGMSKKVAVVDREKTKAS